MKKFIPHTKKLCLGALLSLAMFCSGCIETAAVAVVLPAVQYGTTAYSGVNFIQENMPHERLDLSQADFPGDKVIERRIIERIKMHGLLKDSDIYVFSFVGHVYLVGHYNNCEEVTTATEIAKNVQGVRLVTTCLYPTNWEAHSHSNDIKLQKALLKNLGDDPEITSRRLRAVVVQGNAVIVGLVNSDIERNAVIHNAQKLKGLDAVVPLVSVIDNTIQNDDNATTPSKPKA